MAVASGSTQAFGFGSGSLAQAASSSGVRHFEKFALGSFLQAASRFNFASSSVAVFIFAFRSLMALSRKSLISACRWLSDSVWPDVISSSFLRTLAFTDATKQFTSFHWIKRFTVERASYCAPSNSASRSCLDNKARFVSWASKTVPLNSGSIYFLASWAWSSRLLS